MSRLGLASALIAAGMLHGLAKAETPEERDAAKDKDPPSPRYTGMDLGAEPGCAVSFSAADQARIAAAEAKRERKAAMRLSQAIQEKP